MIMFVNTEEALKATVSVNCIVSCQLICFFYKYLEAVGNYYYFYNYFKPIFPGLLLLNPANLGCETIKFQQRLALV